MPGVSKEFKHRGLVSIRCRSTFESFKKWATNTVGGVFRATYFSNLN